MHNSIAALYDKIEPDPWRAGAGFTPEFDLAQQKVLAAKSDQDRIQVLGSWFQQFQPCLFGRIAAKWDLISYCWLTEPDLRATDEAIRQKIQDARSEWTRLAYDGKKSGFVIIAATERLAHANPDANLLALATRLCELYLLQEIHPNRIYTDEIFLELPTPERITWRWNVGANYFGAAADGRWWQDHRIPGGVGFSMNSVGHLVKSTVISGKIGELEEALGISGDHPSGRSKIGSLPKALEMAMRTIEKAAPTPWGRATELLPLPADISTLPVHPCPTTLPSFLTQKNYCQYQGYYHTDETVPAEYFRPDVARPADVAPKQLDFTYLIEDDILNPDFVTTGTGRRVRDFDSDSSPKGAKSSGRRASAEEFRESHR